MLPLALSNWSCNVITLLYKEHKSFLDARSSISAICSFTWFLGLSCAVHKLIKVRILRAEGASKEDVLTMLQKDSGISCRIWSLKTAPLFMNCSTVGLESLSSMPIFHWLIRFLFGMVEDARVGCITASSRSRCCLRTATQAAGPDLHEML